MGETDLAGQRRRRRPGRRRSAFRPLAGNRVLLRVVAAYALFIITEYAVWVALLVFAYHRGGATAAGLIAVAQLVPAAVLAPVVAALADRRSPVLLLAGGYVVQAAAMAATAAAVAAGQPGAAYVAAVIASTAVTTTRPAQSTLIPSVSVTPDQLTAANVVVGWVEAAAIALSGLLVGVLIAVAGVASVFAACAGLGLMAVALVARLRIAATGPEQAVSPGQAVSPAQGPGAGQGPGAEPAARDPEGSPAPEPAPGMLGGLGEGLRLAAGQPKLRLMLALLTAEAVVVGAFDLLFVILAVGVLSRPQAWAGYLNSVYGAATMSAALVGRRLGLPILVAGLLTSGALVAMAAGPGLAGTVMPIRSPG